MALIMTCITSVSFSFLLNGEQFDFLSPERGLRPSRDPLSPYLFLLCAEAFSSMIRKAETEGALTGIAVSRLAPRVSHLLFVDDTLIFYQATRKELLCVKRILTSFEKASGLMINSGKSAMSFSRNVDADSRTLLANILGAGVVSKYDKYLGLPTVVGCSGKEAFSGIKEQIWKKLQNWSSKQLSQTGCVVLIQDGPASFTHLRTELFPPSGFTPRSELYTVLHLAVSTGYEGYLGGGSALEGGRRARHSDLGPAMASSARDLLAGGSSSSLTN
ncbi:UNVERIFIED_CONTAM: hypothetical protein Slati_1562400 [Sesamum latifolium]|uniref:Reverse transcriptase domain-containing protein n=1 Tax=Sesamum latifolium TaxID=2727402 RepID=A0AAW2XDS5_9LAMI